MSSAPRRLAGLDDRRAGLGHHRAGGIAVLGDEFHERHGAAPLALLLVDAVDAGLGGQLGTGGARETRKDDLLLTVEEPLAVHPRIAPRRMLAALPEGRRGQE